MNADTGSFRALTAEVAGLAEQVRGLAQREIAVEAIFQAGFQAGQDDVLRPAGKPVRPRAGRARRGDRGHLRPVQGDLR